MEPLRILFAASEVAPFAKTGGLADVSAGLCRYLHQAGHDVRLFMPMYRKTREAAKEPFDPVPELQDLSTKLGDRTVSYSISTAQLGDGPLVYFVRCPEFFDRDSIYGDAPDEPLRFAFLSQAAIECCQQMQWSPQVAHCNDWHTALLPLLLKAKYAWDALFKDTRSVLTIHNLGYQGLFSDSVLDELGWADSKNLLHADDTERGQFNFLKTGLLYADAITTVSQTYAREIQSAELGMGLEELLSARSEDLVGIVNGVDYTDWSPESDALLPHTYSADDLAGKAENKRALLGHWNLEYDASVPLIGIVSRLTGQKGFELLPDILPVVLQRESVQLVILGSGEERYENYFQWLQDSFPTKVCFYKGYNNELAHLIEAGADMFLMPSRYEPCGMNQMYSLKYGTAPIVRKTGGLADTVEPFDPATGKGTGFVFEEFSADALFQAVRRGLDAFKDRAAWKRLMLNGMSRDFSWDRQGKLYEELYSRLLEPSRA